MADSVSSTSSTAAAASTALRSLSAGMFQASGLASGLNTSVIVDALIAADSGRLNALKRRQSDYEVQISTLGTLASQLQAVQTAASSLATGGVVSIKPSASFDDFTVSGSAKAEGSFTIQVGAIAKEAKIRSTSFTSAQDKDVVPDGTLKFNIDGKDTVAIDTTNKTLADVAEAINQNISELNATVLSTSSGYYLSVARKSTGFTTTAGGALTVVSDPGLAFSTLQTAENASLTIDGLAVSRTSNTISDVIPGTTLNLVGESGVENKVKFVANSGDTEKGLQAFVDAFNTLAGTLRSQLVTDPTQSYGDTLLSHSTTATIQSTMQQLMSKTVVASGSVRTLADLGLELQQDGTISLNTITLYKAVQNNPSAANTIFSQGTTGIADTIKTFVKAQTNTLTGNLVLQQKSLKSSILDMTDEQSNIQAYLDKERARLVAQFTSMETLISGYNAATSYLTQVANLKIQSG
jgi:flagellar hook-associated protein 2